jgi:hypothetical protein
MIRLVSIFAAAALASTLPATVTTSFGAPARSQPTASAFSLRAGVAGRITTIQTGQTLTFVFTETNRSNASAPEDLGLKRLANATLADESVSMVCVRPGGATIYPDTPSCEPGVVKPGQHASMVLATTVTGPSGTSAVARVCLSNENTGAVGPCLTKSVRIA